MKSRTPFPRWAREPYHLLRFMTDADGRFQIDHCPPGRYVLHLTRRPGMHHYPDAWIWVRVRPETTTDLELFAPGRNR